MLPFSEAVSVAFTAVTVVSTEAVNTALLCPTVTVTLAGTVTVGLLLDSATVLPPAGAAPLSVTVQLDVPGPVTVPGAQLKVVTCSCGDTLSPVVAVLPFSEAVSVALTAVTVVSTEAVNTALLCPAVTVTLAGTVTVGLLLDSATVLPPAGAVPLSVTVQLDVPGPVTVPGAQLSNWTVSGEGSVMVPPDFVVGIDFPFASEVEAPDSESGIELVANGEI